MAEAPPPRRRYPPILWALAAVPALPLALALGTHVPPGPDDGVVSLAGTWRVHEGDLAGGADPDLDDREWPTLVVPGAYSQQGFTSPTCWMRTRFVPSAAQLDGEDSFLMLTSVRNSYTDVYVNGVAVGAQGVREQRFRQEQSGTDGLYVARSLLHPGENTVALFVTYPGLGLDGIVDGRLMIGPRSVVKPYFERTRSVQSFLEHGAMFGLGILIALILFLWRLDRRAPERVAVYRGVVLLLSGVVAYLAVKTGFPVSYLLPFDQANTYIPISIALILVGAFEFGEAYYLGPQASRLRRANRVIVGGFVVAFFAVGSIVTYRAFSLYILFVIFTLLFLSLRDLWRGDREFGPLVVMAVVIVVAAALNDVLTDVGVLTTPRLFTFAASNLGVFAAVVAIGEFIRIHQQNDELGRALAHRNEELAEALIEARETARLKSEFLANTSHELRSPLNAIINIPQGLIEQFERIDAARCAACQEVFELEASDTLDAATVCPACEVAGALAREPVWHNRSEPEDTVRYLETVVASGRHLLAVVNDILDFSRLDAGRMQLTAEEVPVGPLLEELVASHRPLAAKRGIVIKVQNDAGDAPLVADRVKLMQMLINLVSNAIKFSNDDGHIEVRARGEGEEIVFEVTDRGIGIAPADQELIFESFRQVEGGHTRRFGGTGLGLAITRKLAELHGGSVSVTSALGEGSTFRLRLPRQGQAAPAQRAGPHDEEGPSGTAIIVVDDDPLAVETTRLALRPLGLRVEGVTDPTGVIERLLRERPDLLVLDVMMPRVSGIELLRQIRAQPELAGLPVLVSSAYHANRELVLAMGAAFVGKPWRPGELLHEAAVLLDDEAPRAQPPRGQAREGLDPHAEVPAEGTGVPREDEAVRQPEGTTT